MGVSNGKRKYGKEWRDLRYNVVKVSMSVLRSDRGMRLMDAHYG